MQSSKLNFKMVKLSYYTGVYTSETKSLRLYVYVNLFYCLDVPKITHKIFSTYLYFYLLYRKHPVQLKVRNSKANGVVLFLYLDVKFDFNRTEIMDQECCSAGLREGMFREFLAQFWKIFQIISFTDERGLHDPPSDVNCGRFCKWSTVWITVVDNAFLLG